MVGALDSIVRIEIRISNSGKEVKVMNSAADGLRVQLVLINGNSACVEVGGRTPEGATPEEIASLFDRLKAGTLGALRSFTGNERNILADR